MALHPGVSARKAGWTEELVARLRKSEARIGHNQGCVLGPFTTAESLWNASQGGVAFKLGMSLKALRMWMRWMARLRGGDLGAGVYVYRFYPAETNPDLVWTNDAYHIGDDWASGFVRSRSHRGRGGIRFFVRRDKKKVSRAHDDDGESDNREGLSRAQRLVLQARRIPSPSAPEVPSMDEETEPWVEEDYSAGPPLGSHMEMPHAFLRAPENQGTVEMALRTEDVARAFREMGQRNGMDTVVVIALEKIEEALARVATTLADGSLHGLTVALFDLRMAIEEYGWAINVCGWDAGYVTRVRDLSRIIGGIERNVEHSLHLMALNHMAADM